MKFTNRLQMTGIGLLLLGAPSIIWGQWRPKVTSALKIEVPVVVDGRLDEPVWDAAPDATDFIQFQPSRGTPASATTVVKIMFDDEYFYFGFLCFDDEPEKITASLTKRDSELSADDSVYVMLDTFHDRRSGYFFVTNLLGTQWDGRLADNGRTEDNTWDGIWQSAAQRTEWGWSVEIAVELKTIKYPPGEDRTWGMNLGRGIPRRLEFSFWTGPLEQPTKVSQFGGLQGLDLKKAEKKSQSIPHVISQVQEGEKTALRAGLDMRYAFNQLVSGNLTVNPDFATIEADQEQINLTRFEVQLSEKRNFFLEGSEIYRQRIQLFYSRRIGDIYGGAKVYGKTGNYEFSGMAAQAKPDDVRDEDSANFSVFRVKRDVMTSSNIGFLLANKLLNGKNRGTAGFDTALHFSDTFQFTGQFASSYGDNHRSNIAFFLRPSYDSSTFHIHLRYTQIGEYFADNANAVGFIRDDNRRELDSAVSKTWWVNKSGFERVEYDSNYNIYWGLNGTLRSWQIDQELGCDLSNKLSLAVEHTQEYKLYEKKFRNHQTDFELGYNTREWQHASLTYGFGRNFDLDFRLIEGSVNLKLTQDLSLEYGLERLVFNPDPERESTWLHIIRATNYFTNDLFIKLFYQINTAIDKYNIQVLGVYRFQPPFGTLQLAYQKGTGEFGERGTQGHTLFFKFAYMF